MLMSAGEKEGGDYLVFVELERTEEITNTDHGNHG
jgi:hypothetical protein